MRALTLHQPWASLIAVGAKTIETRSWSTKYRGPIAIHAAKTEAPSRTFAAQMMAIPALDGHAWNEMPFGAVVAIAELVDVLQTEEIMQWTLEPHPSWHVVNPSLTPWLKVSEHQRPYGDYSPGRFVWLLKDIRAIEPRPVAGKQGLWTWEVTK